MNEQILQRGRILEPRESTLEPRSRIAVVGAGVAGVVAAYLLDEIHEVTLFEKADRLGGHTHTVMVEEGIDAGTLIDTGFIVLNDKTYPLFQRFLESLGVCVEDSDMSFGVFDPHSNTHYAGTSLNGLFSDRRNLARPRFWRMLRDLRRFCLESLADLERGRLTGVSLGDYVRGAGYSLDFIEDYLIPMGGAIWSASEAQVMDYPAETFVRFFKNHGLLSLEDRPRWQTLTGRGISYLRAFARAFTGSIHLNSQIAGISRGESEVFLRMESGEVQTFDAVVLACHADQSFRLLEDPSPEEKDLFSPWRYQKNLAVLHTDSSLLPPVRRAWASWNVLKGPSRLKDRAVCVTYHMNRLQNLTVERDYFVTLNPSQPIDPSKIHKEMVYHHPIYDLASVATQERLPALNGKRNTFFCGSYFRNGFHEDAVRSGSEVGRMLGVAL